MKRCPSHHPLLELTRLVLLSPMHSLLHRVSSALVSQREEAPRLLRADASRRHTEADADGWAWAGCLAGLPADELPSITGNRTDEVGARKRLGVGPI